MEMSEMEILRFSQGEAEFLQNEIQPRLHDMPWEKCMQKRFPLGRDVLLDILTQCYRLRVES